MPGINFQVLNENGKYNAQIWLRWAASKRRLVWQPVSRLLSPGKSLRPACWQPLKVPRGTGY